MSAPKSTLYTHATILTINPLREVILDGYILVTGNRITSIGKTASIKASSLPSNASIISLSGRIVLPGLINTHAHLAQSLLRGLAEDLPLHSWLCDAIWPLEASYDADDGYVAARLTIAEMLKSGTTCFLESMLTHRSGFENVVRAVGESGIRACLVCFPRFVGVSQELVLIYGRASSSNLKRAISSSTSPIPATKTCPQCPSHLCLPPIKLITVPSTTVCMSGPQQEHHEAHLSHPISVSEKRVKSITLD
jgi:cytosine/adenosine deaminase-related metal-dependent hydrolase